MHDRPACAQVSRSEFLSAGSSGWTDRLVHRDSDPEDIDIIVDQGYPMMQLPVYRWFNIPHGSAHTTFGDGHVYLLIATASWCGPCQHIYPAVAALPASYAQRGLHVLYVTRLFGQYGTQTGLSPAVEIDSLQHYFAAHRITQPVAITGPANVKFGNFPRLVAIDGAGKVRKAWSGWDDGWMQEVTATIDSLLPKQSPTELRQTTPPTPSAHSADREAVAPHIPGVPNRPDVVTVIPFYEKPNQTEAERFQVMIPAEVDGHRGNFLVDLGDPDLDLNRYFLQPSPTGGVDTVTAANRLPEKDGDTDDPKQWDKAHVTLRIGTLRVEVNDPDINAASNPHQFNATLNHMHSNFGVASEPPFFAPRLGDLGLCVFASFETIIDFRHRRLILIRLDSAGHRLAAVPAYTPRWSAPLIDIPHEAVYYGMQHWWGLAVRPDQTLDTRTPAKNTVIRQIGTLPWAYEESPEAITWNNLGYSFFSQLGVVGFNPRTHQFLLYREEGTARVPQQATAVRERWLAGHGVKNSAKNSVKNTVKGPADTLPVDTIAALTQSLDIPDTVTDTTTALWRRCSQVWEQKQRQNYKRWADASNFDHFNQHLYPCVRNAPVYLVAAQDFLRLFAPYTPPRGSDTTKPVPYSFLGRGSGEYVVRGADGYLKKDTMTSHTIALVDSPYKGAKEFEQLLEGFREQLGPRIASGPPVIVLNRVVVTDMHQPIDINHLVAMTVLTGPRETYTDDDKPFFNPNGAIILSYWLYP